MQVHMVSLYSAIVLLANCVLGTSDAPAFGDHTSCNTSPAVVGGSGSMTFHFRHGLNMSSETFIAYIKRTGDTANVIRCDVRVSSGITCEIINQAFKPTTIVNHSLTLTAADVTPELEGSYALRTFVGGDEELPVKCYFEVQNNTKGPISPHKASSRIERIVVPVVVVVVVVVAALITVLVLKKKNKLSCTFLQTRNASAAPHALEENKRSEEHVPFLEMEEDVKGKLWYCLQTRHEDFQRFKRNEVDGSFGIGRCPQNKLYFILKVYFGNKLNSLRLSKSESGFHISDTNNYFETLSDLVAHYRENDIIHKATSYGKLVKPFEKAPEGPWYVGKMERQAQDDILLSEANGPGAFLIRESITKNDAYTLAKNIEGEVNTHRITVEDDGYKLGDADGQKLFPTLSALVEYYTENDLYVHNGKLLGRLSTPAQVNPKCPFSVLCLRCCRCTMQAQGTGRERKSSENQGTRSLSVSHVRDSM